MRIRPRRLRANSGIRRLARETHLATDHLIAPLFVVEGKGIREEIASMPGQYRLSLDEMAKEVRELAELGIPGIALFPKIEDALKDVQGSASLDPEGLIPRAIRAAKEAAGTMLVITDVALDPYSSDGHDGIVKKGRVQNDETLELLAGMAVVQADAGADIVAPSDMMDGRVKTIRNALDAHEHTEVAILSYTAKYASAFYGPFRDALDSAPRTGRHIPADKKTYQMDPANGEEALRELELDLAEGADMVMVKPALPYLDVIYRLRQYSTVPVAAYNVSGEYAMLAAAARNGWIDRQKAMMESLTAIRRAGADIILTYFAKEAAKHLN
ncbi:MAG: porphobilinogen synthase [Bacteroidetes bacterium SB0662_bin_6]|nr:porphobilinogen synthase [Bacteroidetes bacterium SB0668_bin_1]MYE04390.1 porphobilinogen synthase [Bacteroidetes bacterium SB0662_bin_6]